MDKACLRRGPGLLLAVGERGSTASTAKWAATMQILEALRLDADLVKFTRSAVWLTVAATSSLKERSEGVRMAGHFMHRSHSSLEEMPWGEGSGVAKTYAQARRGCTFVATSHVPCKLHSDRNRPTPSSPCRVA